MQSIAGSFRDRSAARRARSDSRRVARPARCARSSRRRSRALGSLSGAWYPLKAGAVFAAVTLLAIGLVRAHHPFAPLRAGQCDHDACAPRSWRWWRPGRRTGVPLVGRELPRPSAWWRRRSTASTAGWRAARGWRARSARGSTWRSTRFLIWCCRRSPGSTAKPARGCFSAGCCGICSSPPAGIGHGCERRCRRAAAAGDLRRPDRRPEPDDRAGDPAAAQRPGGRGHARGARLFVPGRRPVAVAAIERLADRRFGSARLGLDAAIENAEGTLAPEDPALSVRRATQTDDSRWPSFSFLVFR